MRWLAYAALILSLVAFAGCDGNDGGGNGDGPAWTADDLVDVDDAALVTEFNAYADAVDEQWERNPVTVVVDV